MYVRCIFLHVCMNKLDPKKRVAQRIDKFCAMGVVNE